MSAHRLRLLGILLSVAWIAAAGIYGCARAAAEVHREIMFCFRMQAEAKASSRCAPPDAPRTEPLCGYKEVDCEKWSSIAPQDAALIAAVALVPPALIWTAAFALGSRRRRA